MEAICKQIVQYLSLKNAQVVCHLNQALKPFGGCKPPQPWSYIPLKLTVVHDGMCHPTKEELEELYAGTYHCNISSTSTENEPRLVILALTEISAEQYYGDFIFLNALVYGNAVYSGRIHCHNGKWFLSLPKGMEYICAIEPVPVTVDLHDDN